MIILATSVLAIQKVQGPALRFVQLKNKIDESSDLFLILLAAPFLYIELQSVL